MFESLYCVSKSDFLTNYTTAHRAKLIEFNCDTNRDIPVIMTFLEIIYDTIKDKSAEREENCNNRKFDGD